MLAERNEGSILDRNNAIIDMQSFFAENRQPELMDDVAGVFMIIFRYSGKDYSLTFDPRKEANKAGVNTVGLSVQNGKEVEATYDLSLKQIRSIKSRPSTKEFFQHLLTFLLQDEKKERDRAIDYALGFLPRANDGYNVPEGTDLSVLKDYISAEQFDIKKYSEALNLIIKNVGRVQKLLQEEGIEKAMEGAQKVLDGLWLGAKYHLDDDSMAGFIYTPEGLLKDGFKIALKYPFGMGLLTEASRKKMADDATLLHERFTLYQQFVTINKKIRETDSSNQEALHNYQQQQATIEQKLNVEGESSRSAVAVSFQEGENLDPETGRRNTPEQPQGENYTEASGENNFSAQSKKTTGDGAMITRGQFFRKVAVKANIVSGAIALGIASWFIPLDSLTSLDYLLAREHKGFAFLSVGASVVVATLFAKMITAIRYPNYVKKEMQKSGISPETMQQVLDSGVDKEDLATALYDYQSRGLPMEKLTELNIKKLALLAKEERIIERGPEANNVSWKQLKADLILTDDVEESDKFYRMTDREFHQYDEVSITSAIKATAADRKAYWQMRELIKEWVALTGQTPELVVRDVAKRAGVDEKDIEPFDVMKAYVRERILWGWVAKKVLLEKGHISKDVVFEYKMLGVGVFEEGWVPDPVVVVDDNGEIRNRSF